MTFQEKESLVYIATVIQIVFSIINTIVTREKEPKIKDERDKLFDLRIARNSSTMFMIGFYSR
jgi:hypothetical protein